MRPRTAKKPGYYYHFFVACVADCKKIQKKQYSDSSAKKTGYYYQKLFSSYESRIAKITDKKIFLCVLVATIGRHALSDGVVQRRGKTQF